MDYHGKLYGKNGSEIIPLMMHSDDVDLLEVKVMMCQDIVDHLAAWLEGATLDPIKLKGMIGTVQSDFVSQRVSTPPNPPAPSKR